MGYKRNDAKKDQKQRIKNRYNVTIDEEKLFDFILQECGADPNAGSRNPFSLKMVRQQNEGNMPLMVAARSGLVSYVETLCAHKDIILNQQDSNGFTALIKVAFKLGFCFTYIQM